MQYFLSVQEFQQEPLFDASMMVHFRKRFPVEDVARINEYVCTGKWPEAGRGVDRNSVASSKVPERNDKDDDSDSRMMTRAVSLQREAAVESLPRARKIPTHQRKSGTGKRTRES